MPQQRDKRTNEQEQMNIATIPVSIYRQNQPLDVAVNPSNSPELELVEKLKQQLNDLKEMVFFFLIIVNKCSILN